MIETKDIRNDDSLKEWLKQTIAEKGAEEGGRIATFIAHRACMRTLPIFWQWVQMGEPELGSSALPVLRASLLSGVSCLWLVPELRIAADNYAFDAHVAANKVAHVVAGSAGVKSNTSRATAAAYAAAGCVKTVASSPAPAVAARAVANTLEATGGTNALWSEIRLDARAALAPDAAPAPLWAAGNPLGHIWAETKSTSMSVPEGPTHWSFWRRWYDDALKGGPPRNPELLKAVALIDPEDWDKGPVFINDVKIPELQAEHARHIASTAAEIVRDDATGAFKEVAVSDLEEGLLCDARERADEAIADFRTFIDRPQSPYGAFAEDLDLIEMQLSRAADRPIRCYENLADAMLVILDIAKYNGLETDGRVTRLVREFERSRRDLRADDDKIAAREAKRIRIGYDELMDAEQEDFRAMLTEFAHKSDDTLEAEMKEDEATIASAETLPEVRDRALLRSSERMVQMDGIEKDEAAKAKPSLEDVGKKADAVNKVAKATGTGFNVIGKIVEWFLT